ncbi:MAG: glycogen debranching N-terminal domain-containing protein [Candidatus Sulfotelmatobacter sp.]
MDGTGVTQQYYIAAGASPSEDRVRVLKYGKCFAVFNRYGDIEPLGLGEHGIYFQGTRYLSELALLLWQARPLLLSSTIKSDNFVFTADLANVDVSEDQQVVIPRGTLHIVRSRFLWQGVCHEEFKVSNYGLTRIDIPLSVAIGADFADIFEVRGTRRERRGNRLEDEIKKDSILMTYEGLDNVVRQTRIDCRPAPVNITASELRFETSLDPGQSVTFQLSVICNPTVQRPVIGYERAFIAAESELKAVSATLPKISSSNDRFNRWAQRSIADVEMMILGNPETNYPYAGVPWFSTVFGRDGIITALEMLWIAPWIGKGVLEFLASVQATEVDLANEAQPGKILHEMRRGEMANLGEVPFGRYYGSVDSTPLFVMLAGAYLSYTGDSEFLKRLWPHVDLALEWIDHYGDVDGDGFVEYARHGSKGLIQQGWKDSNDSVFHADGTLADAPIALCEVQGYVYAAKMAGARICAALHDPHRQAALENAAAELQRHFEESFWCDEISTYALALDGHKQACRIRTSNPGHCLFSGIASWQKAHLVSHTLMSRDMFSGFGVRTVGSQESRYNPLSYHNGSVWPHDNAIIAAGLARYGFRDFAGRILMGLLDVSNTVDLHRLPELFCGVDRREGESPTLYPVACSPQSWAAASVFMVLQACLGISVDGQAKRIIFDRPYLPEGIPQLWIRGLCIDHSRIDLSLQRHAGTVRIDVLEKQGQAEVVID